MIIVSARSVKTV